MASRPRRVLMITHDFPPAFSMAGETCAQIARYLPLYGWDPVALTARDPHGENRCVSSEEPAIVVRTGAVPHPLAAYRAWKRLIARLGSRRQETAVHSTSPTDMGRLRHSVLSLLQVPDTHTGWVLPAVIAGLGAIQRYGVAHLLSSSPHSTNHLVGWALARLSGLPWTAHFQDPWTYPWNQWRELKPVSALSARLERMLERMVLRRADAVVCVTERHTDWLRETYPAIPAGKFVTIPNGFDGVEWERVDEEIRRHGRRSEDRLVITYSGNLYHRRSPLPVFRALRSLIDSGDVVRESVQIDLLGHCDVAGGTRVAGMAEAYGLNGCVKITGFLERAETLRRVAQSDLLLLLAEELTQQIPGKTYEYLRAGRPILALTSEGAAADLLRRTGGAWVVDPDDEKAVREAVREAYRLWKDGRDGPRPDQEIVMAFDRRVLAGRFAELFYRVMSGGLCRGAGAQARPRGSD